MDDPEPPFLEERKVLSYPVAARVRRWLNVMGKEQNVLLHGRRFIHYIIRSAIGRGKHPFGLDLPSPSLFLVMVPKNSYNG